MKPLPHGLAVSCSKYPLLLRSKRSGSAAHFAALGSRGEMHVKAFMVFQPSLHFWMLVRGVVVDDQMQLKMLGCFSIDLLEKL